MLENGKKIFDPTKCFMFFGTWADAIRDLERPEDKNSPAYMLFKAIADYSMFDDEPDFLTEYSSVKMLQPLWKVLSDEIDRSIEKRKSQFDHSAPSNRDREIVTYAAGHPEESYKEIGRVFGITKSSVGRVIDKYREIYENLRHNASGCKANADDDADDNADDDADDSANGSADDSANGSDNGSADGSDNGSDNGSDTSGTGQSGTERDRAEQCETPQIRSWREKYEYNVLQELYNYETINNLITEYLSKHRESPLQKWLGDKYGRWITGWDKEKDEPIISYPLSYLPKSMMRHRWGIIPGDRYADSDLPW